LLSGSDPTGSGDALSGFGDRRETELPVEAGFSRTAAIKIAALKGAVYLGQRQAARLDRGWIECRPGGHQAMPQLILCAPVNGNG